MMYKFLSQLYVYVTHFLSPPRCLHCGQDLMVRTAFCGSCTVQILPIVSFDCYLGSKNIVTVFAVSGYKDPLRALILAKHHGNETAIRFLADFMVESPVVNNLDFDLITFIPLHWTRYASRGFNQAEIIAQKLSDKTGRPILPLLIRSKKTQFQARLSLLQREQNVQDAFTINPKYAHIIAGKKIVIVDDLFTTGATVKAVSAKLLQYKPTQIQLFVACRVINS